MAIQKCLFPIALRLLIKLTIMYNVYIIVNMQVRAVGSTHSWSPLYPDEGNILIDGTSLKSYNGHKILLNKGMYDKHKQKTTK